MNYKKILFITTVLAFSTFACSVASPSPTNTPTTDVGPEQTANALATSQSDLESQQLTLSAQQTSDMQSNLNEQATQSAQETADAAVQVTEQIEEPTETEEAVEVSKLQFESPDTFNDNRNQWIVNEYTEIADGLFQYRKPPQTGSWTFCRACEVTSENNKVSVEGKSIAPGLSIYGLILDTGKACSSHPIAFIINSQGAYAVLQGVFNENGDFSYWRPFIDVRASLKIIKGQNAVNKLSATYEFADEVWMTVFVNDTQLHFKAFESSGAESCVAGLYVLSDIDFDNFSIE